MDLEKEFTNETGRCPDNDVQYYADWLEQKVKKLTSDNSDYAKLLDKMEQFAKDCEKAINIRDAE